MLCYCEICHLIVWCSISSKLRWNKNESRTFSSNSSDDVLWLRVMIFMSHPSSVMRIIWWHVSHSSWVGYLIDTKGTSLLYLIGSCISVSGIWINWVDNSSYIVGQLLLFTEFARDWFVHKIEWCIDFVKSKQWLTCRMNIFPSSIS